MKRKTHYLTPALKKYLLQFQRSPREPREKGVKKGTKNRRIIVNARFGKHNVYLHATKGWRVMKDQ
jgi:hypothetical protein